MVAIATRKEIFVVSERFVLNLFNVNILARLLHHIVSVIYYIKLCIFLNMSRSFDKVSLKFDDVIKILKGLKNSIF